MNTNLTKLKSTSLLMVATLIAIVFSCKKESTSVPTVTTPVRPRL